jgi:hypothetical protein
MNSDSNNEQIYFKKYLLYKKKYLKYNQGGGQSDQYCLYLCIDSKKTENAINILNKDYDVYSSKDVDNYLHLGAYKIFLSESVFNLVTAPNSEKKLKKSDKLVSQLFINEPLDRMKILSRINLMKIIKEFEKKINTKEESKSEENKSDKSKSEEKQSGGAEESTSENIAVTTALMFKIEKDKMSLVLNYLVENNELKDQQVNDNFQIKFIDKVESSKKSFFKFR